MRKRAIVGLFVATVLVLAGCPALDSGEGGDRDVVAGTDVPVGTDIQAGDPGAGPDVGTDPGADTATPDGKCPEANPFCHEHDGLRWTDDIVGGPGKSGAPYQTAKTWCEGLGGRLPTIDQLRTLVQNCPMSETGGACKASVSCMDYIACGGGCNPGCEVQTDGRYSVFGDSELFWSRTPCTWTVPELVWTVNFPYGLVNYASMSGGAHYRCVQ